MEIKRATEQDIPCIQAMAEIVFRHTYASIITPQQMDYMMEWMYSSDSLREQISGDGKMFFIAFSSEGTPCGYVSVEFEKTLEDGRRLFHLQKIYVLPDFQKQGIGEQLFRHVVQTLQQLNPESFRIELNVNRDNPAVGFYQRMGMTKDRQGDFPIGLGFYMNDFIFALDVNND